MLCTSKGSGVSFTGAAITGGVGSEGVAQPYKLVSIAATSSIQSGEFLCMVFLQGALLNRVLMRELRYLFGVLTGRSLTRYSLIACRLTRLREIGFERFDAKLLYTAGQCESGHCCILPPHAMLPPPRWYAASRFSILCSCCP